MRSAMPRCSACGRSSSIACLTAASRTNQRRSTGSVPVLTRERSSTSFTSRSRRSVPFWKMAISRFCLSVSGPAVLASIRRAASLIAFKRGSQLVRYRRVKLFLHLVGFPQPRRHAVEGLRQRADFVLGVDCAAARGTRLPRAPWWHRTAGRASGSCRKAMKAVPASAARTASIMAVVTAFQVRLLSASISSAPGRGPPSLRSAFDRGRPCVIWTRRSRSSTTRSTTGCASSRSRLSARLTSPRFRSSRVSVTIA